MLHDQIHDNPPSTIPVYVVWGAIRQWYIDAGNYNGPGTVTSEEFLNADNAWQQNFQNSYVTFNSATGVVEHAWPYVHPEHWKVEFFNGVYEGKNIVGYPTFQGYCPANINCFDKEISFDLGSNAPGNNRIGVWDDHFAARFTRQVYLESGNYAFKITGDDGVRLSIDGQDLLDRFTAQNDLDELVTFSASSSKFYTIVLEYLEVDGDSNLYFAWDIPDYSVRDIEYSQAIQRPDHSIPMVANRSTIVRVRVSVANLNTPPENLTASLYGERDGLAFGPLTPMNSGVPLDNDFDRDVFEHTLNFALPSEWQQAGNITIWAEVNQYPYGDLPEIDYTNNRSGNYNLEFLSVPKLNIVVVPIAYQPGGYGTIYRPPEDYSDLYRSQFIYPIPFDGIEITTHAELLYTETINEQDDWSDLLGKISELRTIDGADSKTIYYGQLPSNAHYNIHWGIGYVGSRTSMGLYNRDIATHEIGHNLGLNHAPCNVSGSDSYFNGDPSIRDTGIDVYARSLPISTIAHSKPDFMGYCYPYWISAYHYEKLFNELYDSNTLLSSLSTTLEQSQTQILVSGWIDANDAEIEMVYPFSTTQTIPDMSSGQYQLILRNDNGTELSTYFFDRVHIEHESENDKFYFSLVIPQLSNVASMEIREQGLLTIRYLPSSTLNLSASSSEYPSDPNVENVSWEVSSGSGAQTSVALYYSANNGQEWQTVALNLQGSSYDLDTSQLPASNNGLLNVIASDGVKTTNVQLNLGFISNSPPTVGFVSNSYVQVPPNAPLVLNGYAVDQDEGEIPNENLQWIDSETDSIVGSGRMLAFLEGLDFGIHTFILSAVDSEGAENQATIIVDVGYKLYLPSIVQ